MPVGYDLGSGLLADLARINIRYILEWYQNGRLKTAIALPLPPRSLSVTQTAPVEIDYSVAGHAIRQVGAYKKRYFTLNGSAGYDARTGYNREGAIIFQKGDVILREFRAFLEEYQKAVSIRSQSLAFPIVDELVFRALDEDYHVKVEVNTLEVSRDSQNAHFAFDWTLSLTAYEEVEEVLAFKDLQDSIQKIKDGLDTISGALAVSSTAFNGVLGVANLVLSPLDNLTNAFKALDEALEGVSSIMSIPSDVLGRLSQTAIQARTTINRFLRNTEDIPNALSAKYEALRKGLLGVEEVQNVNDSFSTFVPFIKPEEDYSNVALYTTRNPVLSSQENNTSQQSTVYRLRIGEDLTTLARRIFGEASRWIEIADLNGWVSPTQLSSGRYMQAGDIILLPVAGDNLSVNALNDLYGVDLKLKSGGLVYTDNDIQTITGSPNLEQGVGLRLKAISEETPVLLNYGLPNVVGNRLTARTAGYLGSHIRSQLVKDARVESVPTVEVLDTGDSLLINLEFRSTDNVFYQSKVIL
jgi:hypothetical protein